MNKVNGKSRRQSIHVLMDRVHTYTYGPSLSAGYLLCIGKGTKYFTYFVATLLTTLLEKYYDYDFYFSTRASQVQRDEKLAQDHKTSKW